MAEKSLGRHLNLTAAEESRAKGIHVNHETVTGSRAGMPRSRLVLAAVLMAATALWLFLTWRGSHEGGIQPIESSSPYVNTRLGVRFVGDSACTRCHADIAETYRRHPMGQSLAPITLATRPAANRGTAADQFEAKGLLYSVEREGDRVIHKETRRDASGRVIAQDRGRSPVRDRVRQTGILVPDRARRLSLRIADHLVCQGQTVGPVSGL